MKKHQIDRKLFGALRQYDEFVHQEGLPSESQESLAQFLSVFTESLTQHKKNPALRHGLRAQNMFGYVACALGNCRLVSEEDAGDFYCEKDEFRRPDFRILTKDGKEFFVEVKNFHPHDSMDEFSMTLPYASKLKAYSETMGKPLFIAIYWAKWGFWTLNPLQAFTFDGHKFIVSLGNAMKENHMALLGDYTIAINKRPIMRFFSDPSKPRKVEEDGKVPFTIAKVSMLVEGDEVVDPFEHRLAWYLLHYGRWSDFENPAEIIDGELIHFDFVPVKEQPENQQIDILIAGSLSEMISQQFNVATSGEEGRTNLTPQLDPEKFGIAIPSGYKGSYLRVVRFILQPSTDFGFGLHKGDGLKVA